MAQLMEAVRLLEQGDWQAAHRIAQATPSALGSWTHGIVHLMEGDFDNARSCYNRAGRALPPDVRIANEIEKLKAALLA